MTSGTCDLCGEECDLWQDYCDECLEGCDTCGAKVGCNCDAIYDNWKDSQLD